MRIKLFTIKENNTHKIITKCFNFQHTHFRCVAVQFRPTVGSHKWLHCGPASLSTVVYELGTSIPSAPSFPSSLQHPGMWSEIHGQNMDLLSGTCKQKPSKTNYRREIIMHPASLKRNCLKQVQGHVVWWTKSQRTQLRKGKCLHNCKLHSFYNHWSTRYISNLPKVSNRFGK